MTKEGSIQIVNFLTRRGYCAGAWPYKSYSENAFFISPPVYTWVWIRQIKYIVMMTKGSSIKIVNYMTPGTGVLVLGHGHIVKMQCFFSSFLLVYIGAYIRLIKFKVMMTKEVSTKIVNFMNSVAAWSSCARV